PCNTLSQNTNVPETRKVVVESGLVGWYARVLEAGEIHQDDELVLVKRPYPALTVMAVHELLSKPANTLNKAFLEQTLQ
ncbi:MOSC domain-containing protein, partial [Klebsiella aerogenes]